MTHFVPLCTFFLFLRGSRSDKSVWQGMIGAQTPYTSSMLEESSTMHGAYTCSRPKYVLNTETIPRIPVPCLIVHTSYYLVLQVGRMGKINKAIIIKYIYIYIYIYSHSSGRSHIHQYNSIPCCMCFSRA